MRKKIHLKLRFNYLDGSFEHITLIKYKKPYDERRPHNRRPKTRRKGKLLIFHDDKAALY